MTHVAIIGGGYAGMAAGVSLSERGIPVTLLESAKQLGGRARGIWYHETQLDNGQHLLLGCYQQTLRMIEKVGGNIQTDFLRLPLQLDLHQQFSLCAPKLPAPFHLLAGLLGAQGITFASRLKAAKFMLALRRLNFRLSADQTVEMLLLQYQQPAELIEKLWEPLCIAALNTPYQKASAQIFLNVLRDALNQSRADSDMLLPKIDFTALFPQRAAVFMQQRGGQVSLSCGIESIEHLPSGEFKLNTAHGAQHFSHLICTTSATVASKLLGNLNGLSSLVRQIEQLESQPIYSVYLQYSAAVSLPHAMLGLHRRFSQWLFDKGQIAHQRGLLVAVISAEGIHQNV